MACRLENPPPGASVAARFLEACPVLIRLLLLALLAIPAAAAARAPQQDRVVWHTHDCPGPPPKVSRRVECGALEVPENWDRAASRSIYLHVRIFHAARDSGLAPVLFLSGGPGQNMDFDDRDGLANWGWYIDRLMGWAEGRDIVLLSQRGILVDGVGMECAALGDPKVYLGAATAPDRLTDWVVNLARADRECVAELRSAGYEIEGYSTHQSALDVAALRRALGIERWVLFGISYGTRLGLAALRTDPEGAEAAILDSVFPPAVTDHWSNADPFAEALAALFRNCRADARCDAAYPGLEARFDRLLERLARAPVVIHVDPPADRPGERLYFTLDDVTLIDMVFYNLYWVEGLEVLPRGIDALDRGRIDEFRSLIAEPYVYDSLFTGWSWGMQSAVNCNDDFAFFSPDAVRAEMRRHPRLRNWLATALMVSPCEGWPHEPAELGFSRPVRSEVPVLLLAGALDPVTPVSYAELALRDLPNGQLHVVPGVAHAVLDAAECARDLARAFLRSPLTKLPPLCADRDPTLHFRMP